jgi:transcriptional regulator with XRE-family HTH domain
VLTAPADPGTGRTPHSPSGGRTLVHVDTKNEIREFLTSRLARITPEQAGLAWDGGNRRVPGLQREEVALTAGVSVDYYTRLERGNLAGVSESVLEALARTLQLDDVERVHLFHLGRAADTSAPRRRRRTPQRIRPSIQHMLDAMTDIPAFVRYGRLDILAANRLVQAFYSQNLDSPSQPVNSARFAFLAPRAPTSTGTASPRTSPPSCTRRPVATPTTVSCPTSSANSRRAARRSAPSGQRTTSAGMTPASRAIRHPVVGEISLTYDRLDLVADPGLTIFTYMPSPARATRRR